MTQSIPRLAAAIVLAAVVLTVMFLILAGVLALFTTTSTHSIGPRPAPLNSAPR